MERRATTHDAVPTEVVSLQAEEYTRGMRRLLLLLCLVAAPSWAATLSTTTCTTTVRTGCAVMDIATLNQLPSTVGVQLSGTWTGAVQLEGSVNGSTYVAVTARPASGGSWASEVTANGVWTADVAGLLYFRVRASSLLSGTITVHMTPSTARPMVDVVRAVGSTFGEVAVGGVVELGPTSLSSIVAPTCTLPTAPPVVAVSTTPQDVPTSPLTGRTQALVVNHSGIQRVWCCIGTGCTPTSSAAYILEPGGGSRTFSVRATDTIRCRSATGTADVGVEESSCG